MTQHSRISAILTAGICTMAFISSAHADERWPRWYVGLSADVAFVEDSDLSGAVSGDLDYDIGTGGAISVGYLPFAGIEFLDNTRIEAELGYRYAGLDGFTNAGTPANATGSARMLTYMANAYYDFNNETQWTPYLGAGLGGAMVQLSKSSGLGNTDDEDTVFAYQFMAGVTYAPSSMPMTEWGVGYRYFTANSPDFTTTGATLNLDDITSHNIEATARFRF